MQRFQIRDRDYYTVGAIGRSRHITPEGFLLCEGVAIARTGIQTYLTTDLPLEPNADGVIVAERLPEEVFRRETIASFEGKPVTVNHPDGEFVSPENWKRYSVGIVQNVRQGDGADSDLLLADLLITSADAIAYANSEFPQVSAGYDCDYEPVGPGRYIQRNIIGNHVALVRHGRAGPRCAIKDEDTTVKNSRIAKLLAAFGVKDAETAAEAIESITVTGQPTADSNADKLKTFDERLDKLEKGIADIQALLTKRQPTADEDSDTATADQDPKQSAYTAEQLTAIRARAEILAPGIQLPTADALSSGDAAEQLMRNALDTAQRTDEGKECIAPFLMDRELKTLTADALLGVFNGAAELMRVRNNQAAAQAALAAKTRDFGKPVSPEDINEANRKFWDGK